MTKNPANRPSTAEILRMPYVKERMTQFVQDAEMDQMLNGPAVFKKQRPTMKRMGTQHVIAAKVP